MANQVFRIMSFLLLVCVVIQCSMSSDHVEVFLAGALAAQIIPEAFQLRRAIAARK